jgi:hypothetical protein
MCVHNLVKTPEGERPLQNSSHKRRRNIKKVAQDIVDRIHLAHVGEKSICIEHDNDYEVAHNEGMFRLSEV